MNETRPDEFVELKKRKFSTNNIKSVVAHNEEFKDYYLPRNYPKNDNRITTNQDRINEFDAATNCMLTEVYLLEIIHSYLPPAEKYSK